jgi:hypothetical protein
LKGYEFKGGNHKEKNGGGKMLMFKKAAKYRTEA